MGEKSTWKRVMGRGERIFRTFYQVEPIPAIRNWQWRHNFPGRVSIDFSQIRGSRIRVRRRKENELVFLRKLTLLKSKLNRCFLLFSLLGPLIRSNLDANFLGRLWRHKRFWITWPPCHKVLAKVHIWLEFTEIKRVNVSKSAILHTLFSWYVIRKINL